MKKVLGIALIIIGAIGFLKSFMYSNYGADFSNEVLSGIYWILRIISLVIATIGTTTLIEYNRTNN